MKRTKTGKSPFYVCRYEGEGYTLPATWHENSMAILQVVTGHAAMSIGTELRDGEEGDFFFVPPKMVYRAEGKTEDTVIRGLIFDTSIIMVNMESVDSELFYMFEVQSRIRTAQFHKDHPIYPAMFRFFEDALDEYAGKDVCYKLPIRADIYLLVTAMLRHYCVARNEHDRMIYHNVCRMKPVLDYIDDHCSGKIYISDLSDMLMVSPDYFTRMFKESIGKTPVDYINGLRVAKAQILLCDGVTELSDISDKVGFCNTNDFHKIFRQYMGESPMAYRKSSEREEKDASPTSKVKAGV